MTPRLPDNFFWHVLGVLAFFFLGVIVIVLQSAADTPGLTQLGAADLLRYYLHHVSTVIPFLAAAFLRLIFLNCGVALFIICVPMFWVWTWWFRRDVPGPIIVLMKGTVLILMMAMGHNSFPRLYLTYKTLPFDVFATLYYPHGILEIFAFLAAGVFSLTCIDSLHSYLQEHKNDALHPGDVGLFIFGRIWSGALCIMILLIIAAFIESQVTPLVVKAALEHAILANMRE